MSLRFFTAVIIFFMLVPAVQAARPVHLRCEHMVRPLGIDSPRPRLSWQMEDATQAAIQTAYQIRIGTDSLAVASGKAGIWDSGRSNGDANLVSYGGPALKAFTRYFWQVTIWDRKGEPSRSAVQAFETGMMGAGNWRGNWISDGHDINFLPAGYFRKGFQAPKKVRSARAYIAVAGLYELYLNGKKVSSHRLDPMYTRFDRRTLYVTHDVTGNLQQGRNAVGVLLGNGWYNHQSIGVWNFERAPWRARPAFCMDLRITYEDGTTEVVSSGTDWKTDTGALTFNSIYTAEHYDFRKEQSGWNTAAFDDSKWSRARFRTAPSLQVVSQVMQPIRNVEKIAVQSLKKFGDTCYVFDLGRNIAGVSQIRVSGPEGTVLRLRHAERLYPNGRTDLSNIDVYHRPKDQSDPFQTDIVTLSGKGTESFMPRFNYKGFQYVEVTSSRPVQLNKESLTGYFMHSDVAPVGTIRSSNPLIDRLWWATNNSYLSNLFGYPTDCPQREKNGWTGDGHFAIETGLYNFDAVTIYEKWLADHRDEQQPNGVLPDIIPTGGWGYGTANGTDWTSTIAIIPWNIYQFYGDSKLLRDSYESIKRYVAYVENGSTGYLTTFGRGDWVPVKSTSSLEYTSSVYFYTDALILAKAAKLFGNKADQNRYEALAKNIRTAINNKYFKAADNSYASGTQTELSMALQWGIVPEASRLAVARRLAERVAADGMHLDVGVLGAKAILNALSENGQAETAYRLAAQDTYPSWGWWIVNGATTLYENWNIQAERDISLNHMMFGEIGGWFFKGLAGIRTDEHRPGFKHILFKPNFVEGLSHFEGSHDGPQGRIVSAWKRQGKTVRYSVVVPANSTATVFFPLKENQSAWQGAKRMPASLQLTAGKYSFEISENTPGQR
ncbi:alpha-rhamnosidase [Pedobacter yulinensis]|uniref:alpha-L-rhamnosidase n=1 Tax=Pedobacter yulinensis TaxID=2126353 RepID=A0A2T3HMA9_9SPHI|nr:alpha-L-rhamnosidase [Pedobacter yulinensis]PST83575.1 alpha-rhamnosidase [Pedobacter yulinensis]